MPENRDLGSFSCTLTGTAQPIKGIDHARSKRSPGACGAQRRRFKEIGEFLPLDFRAEDFGAKPANENELSQLWPRTPRRRLDGTAEGSETCSRQRNAQAPPLLYLRGFK